MKLDKLCEYVRGYVELMADDLLEDIHKCADAIKSEEEPKLSTYNSLLALSDEKLLEKVEFCYSSHYMEYVNYPTSGCVSLHELKDRLEKLSEYIEERWPQFHINRAVPNIHLRVDNIELFGPRILASDILEKPSHEIAKVVRDILEEGKVKSEEIIANAEYRCVHKHVARILDILELSSYCE